MYGSPHFGDISFDVSCKALNHVLDTLTSRWPGETLKVTVSIENENHERRALNIFVERIPEGADEGWQENNFKFTAPSPIEIPPELLREKGNAFKNPIRNYLRKKKQKQASLSFSPPVINNEVHFYQLRLRTFVDEKAPHGYLTFDPNNKLRVFYSLKDVTKDYGGDLIYLYQRTLHRSELYEEYNEFHKLKFE